MTGMGRHARIAIVGDFNPEFRTHPATNASLAHSAEALGRRVDSEWLGTADLAGDPASRLRDFDGVWISAGSPYRSAEGAFAAIRFAREHRWPLIGT